MFLTNKQGALSACQCYVKDKLQDVVGEEAMCRRFKLIGIYDIENVIEQTRNIIWNVL